MLQDLGELAEAVRKNLNDKMIRGDVKISPRFCAAFRKAIYDRSEDSVEYSTYTSVVCRKKGGNLYVYIPNQWFYIAAFFTPFAMEVQTYKQHFLNVLEKYIIDSSKFITTAKKNEMVKDIISSLKKKGPDAPECEKVRKTALDYFLDIEGDRNREAAMTEAYLLMRFATEYGWWYGEKTIDRNDFLISAVTNLAGIVQNSQSYVADIVVNICNYHELREAALQMITEGVADKNPVEPGVPAEESGDVPRVTGGKNEIVYGAPGTGKSYYIDTMYGTDTRYVRRVTFYPEYTYFDFVGSYKPVPLYKDSDSVFRTLDGQVVKSGEPFIDYRFVPGPFLQIYMDAWKDPGHMYTLIIEEINRASAAGVFGDIFQLLDRDIDGYSKYPVMPSTELFRYMAADGKMKAHAYTLRLPSNLNLLATMNSADQGVEPLDTAFKRRWGFRYIPIQICTEPGKMSVIRYAGEDVYWERFITGVNQKIINLLDNVDEDRLIGPYFVSPMEVGKKKSVDKLLLYLWDDVLRSYRSSFFNKDVHSFSDLSAGFEKEDVLDLMTDDAQRKFLSAAAQDHSEADDTED